MELTALIQHLICGISEGMGIFIGAAGLTLILGSLGVLNIAHGSMYMIGAYFFYSIIAKSVNIPYFFIAIFLATVGVALCGGLMEIMVIRPIYKLETIFQYVTTFAVTFIVMDLAKIIWGGAHNTVSPPSFLRGAFILSEIVVPKYNIALIVFGVAIAIFLYIFINKTRIGLFIRGITADRLMMSFLGTNVPLIYTLIFMLGCGLVGLAGAVTAPIRVVGPGIDMYVLIPSFIVIVVGGFGSLSGAFIASIILGSVNSLGILFIPQLALYLPFFLMLIVLTVRPWGLLGKRM